MSACTPLVVRARWKPGAIPPGSSVSVLGLLRSTSGLGQGARLFAQALADKFGAPIDVTQRLGVRANLAAPPPSSGDVGGVIISHLNPPELTRLIQLTWASFLKGRRHIGYWAWELPTAPASWRRACGYVDEIWAPSTFTAEAIRAIAPPNKPIRVVPHPIAMMPHGPPDRERFNLPADAIIVLAALDLYSTLARKNPLGALEAYRLAATSAERRSILVCKVSNFDAGLEVADTLRRHLEVHDDVRLISESLSPLEMSSLVASADIVLSMHRSEGFGLVLAEGMWLEKPVIATAWSGNMDFMDAESSVLVPCVLQPVEDAQGMYADSVWAEPDIAYAADKLAWLIDDPQARFDMGQAAGRRARAMFDPVVWRRRVDQFLDGGNAAP
ncbi:MAG: glycosyltransferase family 4 protein [Burkholderiales bacterium]|nr:glycosyltransferase family 4 protein [Burkholderiales bacterium]